MLEFRHNTPTPPIKLLHSIVTHAQQSRALLLIGEDGWGKVAASLDIAEMILQCNPLDSSNFFHFRNDSFSLKTEFFLHKKPDTQEAWTYLKLLQRRLNMIALIEENLTTPVGVKLTSIKEELNEHLNAHQFPHQEKFIHSLIQLSLVLDKKSGIPINVIREAIKFHSVLSPKGRISILGDFDKADDTAQNSALKLIEEPYPNHWVILTAQDETKIIPTILSRTLKIKFSKPLAQELVFLGDNPQNHCSSVDIMKESLYKLSELKLHYLEEFFKHCAPNIEFGIKIFQFIEQLSSKNHSVLFMEELLKCLEDALIQRQNYIRNSTLDLHYPSYEAFSGLFTKVSVSELEELVTVLSHTCTQLKRSEIKDDSLLPAILLEVVRTLRKTKS